MHLVQEGVEWNMEWNGGMENGMEWKMEWNGECSQLQLTSVAGAVLQG